MKMEKKLLEHKKRIKEKKPDFTRTDNHKKSRVNSKWRKPKGSDNKMRHGFRGYKRCPSSGWYSPKEVSGLTAEGLMPVTINNLDQLQSINEKQTVVISGSTGMRKKLTILEQIKQKKLNVLGIEIDVEIKKIQDEIASRKKLKQKKEKEKEDKKAEEKKAKEKKKKENLDKKLQTEEKTEDEKKQEEKKEKDKLLTTKS